jgi:hypothetical protein|tara:strand:- start:111 stop:287 length:177 start_codon:yes stop_codon:yes gene_type:complete
MKLRFHAADWNLHGLKKEIPLCDGCTLWQENKKPQQILLVGNPIPCPYLRWICQILFF